MSGKNELQRLWTVFQSEKELDFYEKNVLKYWFCFVSFEVHFCQKAEIFHAPFIFYFFKVKTNKYMYNFGSFLNQMLDEKKSLEVFIPMFNEKFNVLWTFSMHSYLCDKNSHNVSMKRAGCLLPLSSLHRNKNPTCTVHMGENMFLGVKLICPRVVACVSSGNRIRMLWTNAHSLVHSFCRSGGTGGGGGRGVNCPPPGPLPPYFERIRSNTCFSRHLFNTTWPSDFQTFQRLCLVSSSFICLVFCPLFGFVNLELTSNSYNIFTILQLNHGIFLEWWNRTKSFSSIWQLFSCLLDEGIPKIWKKLNCHDGFLSYLQNSTANSAHLAANFCPALVCPQKATVRIQFLPYFWNPLIK